MIYATSSLKGGVGKTTSAAFLGQALKAKGRRVLSVDLDHNNNLTDFYLRNEEPEAIELRNIRHVLTGAKGIESVIWSSPRGDIIPATPSLSTVGYELANNPAGCMRLGSALRRLDYDDVIIDTPPALTLELSAGLYAADLVLVPVSAARWTIQAFATIQGEVAKVAEIVGKAPRMLAIPSMVSETAAELLRLASIWTATETHIERNAAIAQAASEGRELKAGTIGARAFAALAEEVAK